MKISELITRLDELQREYGDLEVQIDTRCNTYDRTIYHSYALGAQDLSFWSGRIVIDLDVEAD